MKKNITSEQLFDSIMFNMKGQFVTKYAGQTLIKTHFEHENNLIFAQNNGDLLHLFFNNFRNSGTYPDFVLSASLYFTDIAKNAYLCQSLNYEQQEDDIILNKMVKINKFPLVTALKMRKSERKFLANFTLSLPMLATLLNHAFAVNDNNRRPYASGGALYPVSIFLYIINVATLPPGFYQYHSFSKILTKINLAEVVITKLIYAENLDIINANFIIFYLYNSYTNKLKYGANGAVFACVETGMMMQNVELLATSLNLSLCNIGGFADKQILKYLKLDQYFGNYITNVTVVGGCVNE